MKKGFTLIELLVVIAILAVLMSVIVITLNPAEMLKKTRDTKRIADLDALRTAINLYIADQGSISTSTTLGGFTTPCFASALGAPIISGGVCASIVTSTGQAIGSSTSTSWLPIDFKLISSGSPLSSLPVDPKNTTTTVATTSYVYYAGFKVSTSSFELDANMESAYYSNTGSGDVESKDGGAGTYNADLYEIGSDLGVI